MANRNKVEFGMSMVHIGTYDYDLNTDTVTLGEPLRIPGAVGLSLETDAEEYKFFADDIVYYSAFNDNGESGELTMAMFPDEFKTAFLPYVQLADGGIAKVKGQQAKNVYIAFEGKGDRNKRRHIMYNVSLGAIQREHRTIEEQPEVETEVLGVTITGDQKTGIVKVSYSEEDAGFESLFTTPPVPVLPEEEPGV